MTALTSRLSAPGAAGAMTVTSSEIKPGGKIADEQVFNVRLLRPERFAFARLVGRAEGDEEFAVSMYDPDAPTGSGWWHWWVVNIPADVTSLPKGAGGGTGLPAGAMQGRNDFSANGLGGPCPPPGKPHRYVITVYALGVDKLDVDQKPRPPRSASTCTRMRWRRRRSSLSTDAERAANGGPEVCMQVSPYLYFRGACEQALRFYEASGLGAIRVLRRYEGTPLAERDGGAWRDKILHSEFEGPGLRLCASDGAKMRSR